MCHIYFEVPTFALNCHEQNSLLEQALVFIPLKLLSWSTKPTINCNAIALHIYSSNTNLAILFKKYCNKDNCLSFTFKRMYFHDAMLCKLWMHDKLSVWKTVVHWLYWMTLFNSLIQWSQQKALRVCYFGISKHDEEERRQEKDNL